jgi:predicted DNA-binding protein
MTARGKKQQFSISIDADESLERLTQELSKTSSAQVKKEILEACIGLEARNYYIALGRIQELCRRI